MIVKTKRSIGILISKDDEHILQHTWNIATTGYAVASIKGENQLMHRLITNAKKGDIVDHINRNRLDNRRENLRIVSQSENCFNSPHRTTSKTKIKGVHIKRGKYVAQITIRGDHIHLGTFVNSDDAQKAYRNAFKNRNIV